MTCSSTKHKLAVWFISLFLKWPRTRAIYYRQSNNWNGENHHWTGIVFSPSSQVLCVSLLLSPPSLWIIYEFQIRSLWSSRIFHSVAKNSPSGQRAKVPCVGGKIAPERICLWAKNENWHWLMLTNANAQHLINVYKFLFKTGLLLPPPAARPSSSRISFEMFGGGEMRSTRHWLMISRGIRHTHTHI